MALALSLGMTRAELDARMGAAEFADWMRYASRHPLPERAADIRHGLACQLLANINRGSAPAYRLDEFVPFRREVESVEVSSAEAALAELFRDG